MAPSCCASQRTNNARTDPRAPAFRNIVLIVFLASLAVGAVAFFQLDIEAYPDPSPPMVEFITQNPSWSAEEMEQQVTIPLETGLNGTPKLDQIRSISIFGLSDVKMYFTFDSDYFVDRQEALNRLQEVNLPNNLQPQLSPESPVGEIYRYELTGPGYSLNELKATQDWLLVREMKQVPGIIDVATFGGTTRQYQAEVDPDKLLSMGVTMTQVVNAVQNSNANAGGNYLTLGSQSVNVRGIGLSAFAHRHEQYCRGRTQWNASSPERCSHAERRASASLGDSRKK